MTNLLNDALRLGRVPAPWKLANAVIIKKAPDKDPLNPKSYRPICLINNLDKIQERLLCERIQSHRELLELNPMQYGFRRGKSIDDALHAATDMVHSTTLKYALAILVDIAGAFDNLWWPALFTRLRELRVPKALYNSILDYCKNRAVEWRKDSQKVVKQITKGCPPGIDLWTRLLGHNL